MHLFKRAFVVIGLVLGIHIILLLTNGYAIDQIDTPMHFLGGLAMGMLGLAVHHSATSKHQVELLQPNPSLPRRSRPTWPAWYHYLFVVGFAMLVGIAWEFQEFVFDQTVSVWFDFPKAQISLADTMKDFLLDWLGASVAFFVFRKRV
ncbi:hypothetical protein HY630_00580 [Candidatus Uhrbacteria bacterium]|nr:hypothetical protein [Candidatus Uhrbacteria bacterium]